jgi:hypothetical protein
MVSHDSYREQCEAMLEEDVPAGLDALALRPFEGVIRDHLDVGRPDQIALIFHRRVNRRTPGRFRTRVLTKGVDPTLCCYYKSSRIKQYFKGGWG